MRTKTNSTRGLSLFAVGATFLLTACAGGQANSQVNSIRNARSVSNVTPSIVQAQTGLPQMNAQQLAAYLATQTGPRQPFPANQFGTMPDFKAVARSQGSWGASASEQSLVAAEREAIKDCLKRGKFGGECKVSHVGPISIQGQSDDQKEQLRWRYLRTVHRNMATNTPPRYGLRSVSLIPGSRVVPSMLAMANGFGTGGLATVSAGGLRCTGTIDPIEPDAEDAADPDYKHSGIMEFACGNGDILRGGYVILDQRNQLFFLENDDQERWDFIASPQTAAVGGDVIAFKKLFRKLERR